MNKTFILSIITLVVILMFFLTTIPNLQNKLSEHFKKQFSSLFLIRITLAEITILLLVAIIIYGSKENFSYFKTTTSEDYEETNNQCY
jgi:hypothetical protein